MNKKANCNNCGQKIEFDASMANSLIACPSCGVETKLTEADYHSESKTTEKTAHKAKEQVASGAHIRVGGQKSGDSSKTPDLANIIPPGLANKVDASSSKLTRKVGWIMTVFGLFTFVSNFFQFIALDIKYKDQWGHPMIEYMKETNIQVGMRIDDCFTHCALGLIIAGFGALLLE